MTYIINPWMFYLISLSDTLKWTTGILAIIIFIIAFYYHGEKINTLKDALLLAVFH